MLKGVPVSRVIDGIEIGIKEALHLIKEQSRKINIDQKKQLHDIASIAGRGQQELAQLVVEGAAMLGMDRMLQDDYRFADAVIAREAAENQVFNGVVLNRQALNQEMPREINNPLILVVDDALAPEDLNHDAMKTEAGFQYFLQARDTYEKNLRKIAELGVNVVVADRSIDDLAEEIFTESGIMALQRVSSREIERLCQHTGARKIKRVTLNRSPEILSSYLGKADRAVSDEKLEHTCVYGGKGETWTTIIVGAATSEVVDERERIARDAASAVQAAVREGIVPGGGALEIWLAAEMEKLARSLGGMSSYGVLCVKEAFLKPFNCMASNAGFNPLEKLGDVIAAQNREGRVSISFDCESGAVVDMIENGIVDPALVKINAVKTAGEVATAILRINTIIKMKNEESKPGS